MRTGAAGLVELRLSERRRMKALTLVSVTPMTVNDQPMTSVWSASTSFVVVLRVAARRRRRRRRRRRVFKDGDGGSFRGRFVFV